MFFVNQIERFVAWMLGPDLCPLRAGGGLRKDEYLSQYERDQARYEVDQVRIVDWTHHVG